jgi:threonine dehydratase
VALAARKIGTRAKIFMPLSTPWMKRHAVEVHGGDSVEVVLRGDNYDAAAELAYAAARKERRVYVHAYDDLATMGGQGTLADEIIMSGKGPFGVAYLQIGGGGLAASVGCWLRAYFPSIRLIGVEGVDQASMRAAVKAGRPVTLEYVDVFSDGTAVKRAGDHTYPICRDLIDEFITVTNEEICAAVQALWEAGRIVPEPAGAMGLAGLLKHSNRPRDARALAILAGANMDFGQLAWIANHAGIGAARRRYFRFEIGEKRGTMLHLMETVLEGINIIEFQYGKTHPRTAWPVIGFEASPPGIELLGRRLREHGIPHEDVTSQEDVDFRIIHYTPELFRLPYFIKLEFPERRGALRDFLKSIRRCASLCYFNYAYSGESVGRALMGFEFESADQRSGFLELLANSGRNYREVAPKALGRIL